MIFSSVLSTRISLLGSYQEAFDEMLNLIRKKPAYVTVNNTHTVVEGVRNSGYRNALNNSALSLADGKPLSLLLHLNGYKNAARLFGPTFFEKSIEWGSAAGLKHYFFGSSDETMNKMIDTVKKKFPDAEIAGYCSPPFREFSEEENDYFIQQMNNSGADVFWIGLGAPKQELWMHNNYKKLNSGVMVGIGAGFDYIAGNIKHAPEWMKNSSLEWLYRLFQDPKRLWKRYFVNNSLFILFVFLNTISFNRLFSSKH